MRLLVYTLYVICIIWILKECRQLHIHPVESGVIDVQSLHLSTIETMWESHCFTYRKCNCAPNYNFISYQRQSWIYYQ